MDVKQWCCIDDFLAGELETGRLVDEEIQDLATLFKVLGDPTRIGILQLLRQSSLCVNDLSTLLNMHQTAISHQLKVLRHNRLVGYKKRGKMAEYSLLDEHVNLLMEVGLEHIRELFK